MSTALALHHRISLPEPKTHLVHVQTTVSAAAGMLPETLVLFHFDVNIGGLPVFGAYDRDWEFYPLFVEVHGFEKGLEILAEGQS